MLGYDVKGNSLGDEVYSFTKDDIEIIEIALQAEKKRFHFIIMLLIVWI